jgi:plasmid stabilization system protein ParE
MARVTLTRSAQTDLLEAWLYVAEENQQAADRMLDAIEKHGKGGPYAVASATDGPSTAGTG